MVGLSGGEKSFRICLLVSIDSTSVTDKDTDPHDVSVERQKMLMCLEPRNSARRGERQRRERVGEGMGVGGRIWGKCLLH